MGNPGICPECGTGGVLVYDSPQMEDEYYVYLVRCTECEWAGREVYEMKYLHTEDLKGNKLEEGGKK